MKKILFSLTLILSCFLFVSSAYALEDYYIFNENISAPDLIQNSMNNQQKTTRKVMQNLFTTQSSVRTAILERSAFYCLTYQNTSYENRGICATEPFVVNDYRIYSNEPFYYLTFSGTSTGAVGSILSQGMATNNGGYFYANLYGQPFFLGVENFHIDLTVNNYSNPTSLLEYVSVYVRDSAYGGELSSFTYLNDVQLDKVTKFMVYSEAPNNATFGITFERGFLYYNNTVFNLDDTLDISFGYPTTSSGSSATIVQYNQDLSFPDGFNTLTLARLYFEHNGVGVTNANWTFYRDITDIDIKYTQDDNNNWVETVNDEVVSFTPNIEPVIPGEEDNGATNDDINNSINDINNNIMDDTPPEVDSSSDLVGLLPPGPVDSILNMPLSLMRTMVNDLSSGTCTPVSLPLPFIHENLTLPCLSSIYSQISGLSTFINWLGYIASGWILYAYFSYVYNNFDKLLSLSSRGVTIAKWGSDV